MAFNCKLNRNITLFDISGGDCGNLTAINSGGIREKIYVYNIEDVENLIFSGDTRADNNLIIDTIVTNQPFYEINATSLAYEESYEDGKYTHRLNGNVSNILTEIEDILSDAINGHYLVCFLPNGDDKYKVFGWKNGASLNYSTNISEDSSAYQILFEDVSEFPLFGCESDNFNLANKVFEPTWNPIFENAICEVEQGENNGYQTALYVVKTNSAGQALDVNNMLCQYSSLPQDAYKLDTAVDGGYRIVGTYSTGSTQYYDGKPNRIYSLEDCHLAGTGSISVSPATISLDSTTTSSAFTITSSNLWTLVSNPIHCIVSISQGNAGTTNGTITSVNGGVDVLSFRNIATNEDAQLTVNVNTIDANGRTLGNGTTEVTIPVSVKGATSAYTASASEGNVSINADNSLTISNIATSTNEKTIDVTLVHSGDNSEVKQVQIIIDGDSSSAPQWKAVSQWCQN